MKNSIFIQLYFLFFCITTFGQAKKTTFRVLVGENYIARTNFRNETYLGNPPSGYHEKGRLGLSFQLLSSFYISKGWRFSTGVIMDEKGYTITGAGVFSSTPVGSLDNFKMQETANYLGIPLKIESILFETKAFRLSIDVGLAEQWKISGIGSGEYFLDNQLTLLGGLNFTVPFHRIAFIAHPIFRYSPTHLEDPQTGGSSPSFNAYSMGLELGFSF